MQDPDPEIPDDLEISNDSESFKLSLRKESEFNKIPEMVDESTQTELIEESSPRKKMKKAVKKIIKKEAPPKLLEVLEKTKKDKEKLQNSLRKESQAHVDANNIIRLSMRYVEKAMNGYNKFFVLNNSRENSMMKQRNQDNDDLSDSHESIALKIKRDAIASSSIDKLKRKELLHNIVKSRDFENIPEEESKITTRSKKKKLITRVIKRISPSKTSKTERDYVPSDFAKVKGIHHSRDRSERLYPGTSPLPLPHHSKSGSKEIADNSFLERDLGKSSPSAKSRKRKVIRRVIKRVVKKED